jgi:carboxypeptidase T
MHKLIIVLVVALTGVQAIAADYDRILAKLTEISKRPNTALFALGKNDQGQDIVGVIIGDAATAKVKHLVVGTHHGNERAAAEVPLHFADQVLTNFDPAVLYYVIPVLNISGYNANRRQETGPDQQTHDANRDYEDACMVKQDFVLKSTHLIADFMDKEDIVSAVSVHGYVGTFTFPWGMHVDSFKTLDHSLLVDWAKKAAKVNGYRTGTHGDIVYPAEGSFEDYAYFKHGIWSFLMEIRSPSSDLKKDALSLVEFFKNSPSERSRNQGQKVDCVERILSYRGDSRP